VRQFWLQTLNVSLFLTCSFYVLFLNFSGEEITSFSNNLLHSIPYHTLNNSSFTFVIAVILVIAHETNTTVEQHFIHTSQSSRNTSRQPNSQTAKQPNSQTVKQSTLIHLTYLLDNQSTEWWWMSNLRNKLCIMKK